MKRPDTFSRGIMVGWESGGSRSGAGGEADGDQTTMMHPRKRRRAIDSRIAGAYAAADR